MPSKKTSLLWNTPKEKLEQAVKESNFYREVGEKLDIVEMPEIVHPVVPFSKSPFKR